MLADFSFAGFRLSQLRVHYETQAIFVVVCRVTHFLYLVTSLESCSNKWSTGHHRSQSRDLPHSSSPKPAVRLHGVSVGVGERREHRTLLSATNWNARGQGLRTAGIRGKHEDRGLRECTESWRAKTHTYYKTHLEYKHLTLKRSRDRKPDT